MACSKLEARGHLLHKTGTPPKHFSRECNYMFLPENLHREPKILKLTNIQKYNINREGFYWNKPLSKNDKFKIQNGLRRNGEWLFNVIVFGCLSSSPLGLLQKSVLQ